MRSSIIISFYLFFFTSAFASVEPDTLYSHQQLNDFLEDAKNNKDVWRMAEVYAWLGDYHNLRTDQVNAFKSYRKSIEYYDNLGDSLNLYRVKRSLANYYQKLDLLTEALKLQKQAITYYKEENKLSETAYTYRELSSTYRKAGDPEQELFYLNKCIDINRSVRDTLLDIIINIEKSNTNQALGEYDLALESSKIALQLSREINNQKYIGISLLKIGMLSQYQGHFRTAIKYLSKGLEFVSKDTEAELIRDSYKHLAECHAALAEHNVAYQHLQRYSMLNDSILNADRLEVANRLTRQYVDEEKDQLIEILEKEQKDAKEKETQQRRLIYSAIAAFFAILIAIYVIIRFYQTQISAKEIIAHQREEIDRQKITELENNVKIESMHAMIEGQELERERVAKDLHDSLGGLLSTVKLHFGALETKLRGIHNIEQYKNANQLLDDACQEVRDISRNLQPGALINLGLVAAIKDLINRVDGPTQPDIDFQHYGLDEKLENTVALTVYRLVQELLYNSLKHAKSNEILIQLNRQEKELIIMVEDDGVGFDPEGVTKGMGTENILSRVNYLKGDLSVHSVKGQGTTTMINVPL